MTCKIEKLSLHAIAINATKRAVNLQTNISTTITADPDLDGFNGVSQEMVKSQASAPSALPKPRLLHDIHLRPIKTYHEAAREYACCDENQLRREKQEGGIR